MGECEPVRVVLRTIGWFCAVFSSESGSIFAAQQPRPSSGETVMCV